MADRLLDRLEALVEAERSLPRRRAERRAELERDVAAYLAEHPGASAVEVCSHVRRRRADVIAAMRRLEATGVFPERGNGGQA